MATSIGQIGLDLVVNEGSFRTQMSGIQNLAKKAGAALAGAFAVKKLVDFGKSCLDLGSDLSEVQNVVDVTFPNMSAQVDKFAQSALKASGLSETMAKQYTGTFGAMAKAFGFSEQQAYDMGTALTSLTADVASFYNLSQDEAYTKLKSVFTGETESLKDLGVVMTQTALDSYALANGYGKTTAQMTEAEKVSLRYAFVQQQLSAASGDFARTSGSWANQVRVLKLQIDSLKASIGQGLINLFTPIIQAVNNLLGKLVTLANAFKAFTELITGNKNSGSSGGGSAQIAAAGTAATDASTGLQNAADAANDTTSAVKKTGNAAQKAAKQMRSLMGFDKITKLSEPSDTSSSGDTGDSGNTPKGSGVSGGNLGSPVDFGSLSTGEDAVSKLDKKWQKAFENMKKAIEPTTKALQNLWNNGLARLGKFGWTALRDFYRHFLVPVGKWTMGTGLPRFINALNAGLMKVNFAKINKALADLWDSLAKFTINVGDGLLWIWEKVLVPLGTWTANEVVPRFLETLKLGIDALNNILTALKPLFQWFWDSVLQPLAQWTGGIFLSVWDGINGALKKFSDWCTTYPGDIRAITVMLGTFFAAWKATEMLGFIGMSGGVVGALKAIRTTLLGATAAKIADKAETIYLTALYAKDFVASVGRSVIALGQQVSGIAAATAAKIADKAAQIAMTAATVAWNGVCTIATGITTAFGTAVTLLTGPFGLVVAGIAAAIAAGVLLYKNWDTVCKWATKLKNWVVDKTRGMRDGAVNAFNTLTTNCSNAIHALYTSVTSKWNAIKEKFNTFRNWLASVFQTDWSTRFGVLGNILNAFLRSVKTKVDSIQKVFKGLITFISGVFKGNWQQAWEGIKQIFAGVFQGLSDLARTPVNAIIAGFNGVLGTVNGLINKINGISFKIEIPKWIPGIGGSCWGFNGFSIPSIGSIPFLAQGGYVKPNTPQLAMIGDNRHQGEVVAPEGKLLEMARVAAELSGGDPGKTEKLLQELIDLIKDLPIVELDPEAIRKYFIKKTNQNTKATGKPELLY
ncbi:phage tail protein [Blautia massiliensis (ex Durand et al. 2017)]|uniref:phage tail protein n=1 Tax=Blautia massiliensis (ex Durand et al. 2017) TaxID=1737424 RepID=UPI0022E3F74B|nr:hypothetical protein [Blautia massiliensis (ex Durand et al. 2017)]